MLDQIREKAKARAETMLENLGAFEKADRDALASKVRERALIVRNINRNRERALFWTLVAEAIEG